MNFTNNESGEVYYLNKGVLTQGNGLDDENATKLLLWYNGSNESELSSKTESDEGYEAISYCGREAIEILICETAQEFEDACAIIPLRLSDEEYALELPLDPTATMLAFRQGRFILIGNIDWLYLVRTRLEQAAA